MNNIYRQLQGQIGQGYGSYPVSNMQNLIQKWNQFKSIFNGDAKSQVQDLLNSGKVTQSQYNQAQTLAAQLKNILK